MQWGIYSFVVAAGDETALTEGLTAAGFHDFATSSRSDGQIDLTCYGRGGPLPGRALAVLGSRQPASVEVVDEAQLLAACNPAEPCEVAPGIWVDPGDHPLPDAEVVIRLPAGSAFGDGRHPTTRCAVTLMQGCDWNGQNVLDLGAGTGILGLIAYGLGASQVSFSDCDGDAVRACAEACVDNGYGDAVVVEADLLDGLPSGPYTRVIANLYAELLLLVLADPRLKTLLPRGELICSGISHQKIDGIRQALTTAGFTIFAETAESWWHAVRAQRQEAIHA